MCKARTLCDTFSETVCDCSNTISSFAGITLTSRVLHVVPTLIPLTARIGVQGRACSPISTEDKAVQ